MKLSVFFFSVERIEYHNHKMNSLVQGCGKKDKTTTKHVQKKNRKANEKTQKLQNTIQQ